MKKILKTLLFISILFFPVLVLASNGIIMNLNKTGAPEYTVGEKVEMKFSYINIFSETKNLKLVCGFSALNKEFPAMPSKYEVEIFPSQKSEDYSCEMTISELTPADEYKAYVKIFDENENLISEDARIFSVVGTKKTINANLQTCKSENCEEINSVFINGSPIYLKVSGDVDGKKVEVYLADSNTGAKEMLLDNLVNFDKVKNEMTMKIEYLKPGSYNAIVEISGDGYEANSFNIEFAVINQVANIKTVSLCNLDGECKNGETIQNCPLDCKVSKNKILSPDDISEKKETNIKYFIFAGIGIVILIFVYAAYYFLVKKNKELS